MSTPESNQTPRSAARHEVSTAADSTYLTQIVPLGGTSLTLQGLTSSTQYTVRIRARAYGVHRSRTPSPYRRAPPCSESSS